jgi:WD40 repeat protein/class 3 adenylate cyclase
MLTFLFTDIEGSTRLWEEHTAEMGEVIAHHDAVLRERIEASGGRITKHTGDGVTAAFEGGEPIACALRTQQWFAAEAWGAIGELRIRIGLHAGQAELHAGDYFGPAVNCTARVMAAGWGGQILLTPEVTGVSALPPRATLLDLGEHLLKDVSAPQQIYQLLHPDLPRAEFPPVRTLSGSSIGRTIDRQGQRLVGRDAPAIAVGLVTATLLPTMLGDLSPTSPALVANLGVLGDLGAETLQEWMAAFAQRLRARQEAGEAVTEAEIRQELEVELLERWQAGGAAAVALRADTSRLLQAVQGVEAAMEAAAADLKETLAQGLADLGGSFGEFRWMLAGVQQTLAEVRARQALQLALQREQLDLQRQQLVKTSLLLRQQYEGPPLARLTVEGEVDEEPPADVACPYKGLAAFEADDAEYFFGREELVAELTARLAGTRFLAVVGPSGSGKSSVVRAGLLPAIWQDTLPNSKDWQTVVLTPGHHPLNELAVRISLLSGLSGLTPGALLRDLEADHRGLHLAVRRVLADQPEQVQLLLVVDQFEEVFALCRDEGERRQFIDSLLYAVATEDSRTVVVPTIRADFYGRCADYPHLAARLADNVLVGPLSEGELRQVIERPAELVGLRLEAGLTDTIVGDVAGEPGALPLLSHALLETWQRRRGRMLTLAGYAESGGVAGAIAQTADTEYDQMSTDQQAVARNIFLRLTELGEEGTQDTRRRAAPRELGRSPEEAPQVEAVLRTLADARLITTGEDTVEVAHEALIREWPTLRGWLDEDREGLRTHRHLTEAAQEWERLDREPGELYRGARLAMASEWAAEHAGELNPLEREFIEASRGAAEQAEREKEAARQRELAQARALAEEQERRAEAERERAEEQARRAEEQTRATGRFRRLAIALAAVFLLAVAAAVFARGQQQRAQAQARRAEQEARLATSRELAAAAVSNLDVDPERSVLLALQGLSEAYTLEAENALHESLPALHLLRTLAGHAGIVQSVAVSPDGKRAAGAGIDDVIIVWDIESGEELSKFEAHHDHTLGITFSPDGKRIATCGEDNKAGVWDATTSQQMLVLPATAPVNAVVFSPDGTHLATAHGDATATIWDATSGEALVTLSGHAQAGRAGSLHPGGVTDIGFSPDAKRVATGGADGTARLWDADTGEELLVLSGHTSEIFIAFNPDGTRLATAGEDGLVKVWDVTPGLAVQEPLLIINHELSARSLAFSPDGSRLAAASQDGAARVWDASSGRRSVVLVGHGGLIDDVAFSPDGRRLITSSEDRTVKVWDLAPSREWLTVDGGLALFSPDGRHFTSDLNGITLWDATSGQAAATLPIHQEPFVHFADFSPDGGRLATISWNGTAKVWDAISGQTLLTMTGHTDRAFDVSYSPDGNRLVTASFDGTAKVWDANSGQEVSTLSGHTGYVQGIAYSPDGKRIATASWDHTAKVWDAATLSELFDVTMDTELTDVDFSPDGTRLAGAGNDGTATVWDISGGTGQELFTLRGHTALIVHITFSPDGSHIATASFDGTVKVWDATSGEEWLTLSAGPDPVTQVDFSPDGTLLATSGFEGRTRVYVLRLEDLVALAQSRVTRSLTTEECQKYLHVEECPERP